MNISRHTKAIGFTVVELLVTLVVIAILVSIVIVSYGTYQERTRDAERKSDLTQIAAALKSHATWRGTYIEAPDACGPTADVTRSGWLAVGTAEDAAYGTSMAQCLITAGFLEAGEGVDPTDCKRNSGGICGTGNPTRAYMKMTCTMGTIEKTYVLAYLETAPANNTAINGLCTAASGCTANCSTRTWGTTFGMNYYVEAT